MSLFGSMHRIAKASVKRIEKPDKHMMTAKQSGAEPSDIIKIYYLIIHNNLTKMYSTGSIPDR